MTKFKAKEIKPIYRILFIALLVSMSAQFYFSIFADGFRISAAIILLPLLLMTIGDDLSTVKICTATAASVFILRSFVYIATRGTTAGLLIQLVPNSLFYIFYGFIFATLCQNKFTVSYTKMFVVIFCSDFLSNICEMCITMSSLSFSDIDDVIASLAAIALARTITSWALLVGEKQYRTLLQKEEHEKRYQRLFLMTTGLKNEIYFMKKNSEEIENVMGNAYRLYEKLSSMEISDETKKMSLAIAKDVHEIKKDYLSIIKGIEKEISEEYDEKYMRFSDILTILKDTTYHLMESKKLNLTLKFNYNDDFITCEHYELMSILKNLVTNAIEAIEQQEKGDTIAIEQAILNDCCMLVVKDNGPGISKRHIDKIFNMGYSTKFDTVTGDIYRGVGLYGVKATVEEKFGGTIKANSVYGEGTDFIIKIPKKAIMEE